MVENRGCYLEKNTGRIYTTKIRIRKKIMFVPPFPWLLLPARGPPILNVKLRYFYSTVGSGCFGNARLGVACLQRML